MTKIKEVLESAYPNRYFPIRKKVADYPIGSVYYRVEFFGGYAHSGSYEECYAKRAGFIQGLQCFSHLDKKGV